MSEQTTIPGVTHSFAIADLSLDELLALQQNLGRQADKLREQRLYLKAKIDERLAKGEQLKPAPADGVAPGAVIDVATGG